MGHCCLCHWALRSPDSFHFSFSLYTWPSTAMRSGLLRGDPCVECVAPRLFLWGHLRHLELWHSETSPYICDDHQHAFHVDEFNNVCDLLLTSRKKGLNPSWNASVQREDRGRNIVHNPYKPALSSFEDFLYNWWCIHLFTNVWIKTTCFI